MNKEAINRLSIGVSTDTIEETFASEFASLRNDRPQLFHLAVKEAEALAWQTPFPLLVLPTLISEKLSAAAQWHSRQAELVDGDGQTSFAA